MSAPGSGQTFLFSGDAGRVFGRRTLKILAVKAPEALFVKITEGNEKFSANLENSSLKSIGLGRIRKNDLAQIFYGKMLW